MEKCNCYHEHYNHPECWGTKEKDRCFCGGDETRCEVYPEKRAAALKKYSHVIDKGCSDTSTIRKPKTIAQIKICGGGLTFTITDDMQFEMPTEEQRQNLKKTFGIEIELIEDK